MADYDFGPALETGVPGFASLVEQNTGNGESWIDAATRLLNTVTATYQQKQFIQINMDRARQGLPPLDASQYGLGVQVGISSEVKTLLMWGLFGLGAVLYLTRKR
jgi:hypothetical protein